MQIIYENKEICSKCGLCCKKSGCDYLPKDFEDMGYKYLEEKLNEGNISIVSLCIFKMLPNGKKYIEPFLYLRARNVNREVVDLLSMKTTCSMLKEDGCTYELKDRPSLGVNLIPKENGMCYHKEDPEKLIKQWESYQKVLDKLVRRITGLTTEEKLRLDVEKLFYDFKKKNFQNVSSIELSEIRQMLPHLIEIYSNEYINANKKITSEKNTFVMKQN